MAIISARSFWCLCSSVALIVAASAAAQNASKLFESVQLTPAGEYTHGIEGPAVDRDGNLFVVNLGRQGTIGKLAPGGAVSEKFIDLPAGSVGNAIRFAPGGAMFIADYRKHNIFRIQNGSTELELWFHSDLMSQPNDLTIARDGTIYASDPNWKGRTGQVWRISKAPDGSVQGQPMMASRQMGTTNGIDLSPDERTLYVGESLTGELWAYDLHDNELTNARLVKAFERDTIDGIRTDVSGRLLIARIQKGLLDVMGADGQIAREIELKGKEPSNLAFGGHDGKTIYVTQRQGGYIESFRTDREGREFALQKVAP